MTSPSPVASADLATLRAAAAAAGLTVLSCASWPETDADGEVPALAGFIESTFSPLIAEVAKRALHRRDQPRASGMSSTAIVMVTNRGDVTSAVRVATAVDAGERVSPLQFFQSVPNAVAGYVAARWQLTGPVVCVSGTSAAMTIAAHLIEDADAHDVLIVRVELAVTEGGESDLAAAVLVTC